MKHIDVVIPTRRRIKKLLDCLESIPDVPYVHTIVICDEDKFTYDYLRKEARPEIEQKVSAVLVNHRLGSVACRNQVIPGCNDGVLYATDDVVFSPGAIESAFDSFNLKFPDDDGVVGMVQLEASFHPSGVALLGSKFVDRYPGRKPFNPGYFHFSAQEVHWLAERLGKFYQDPKATLKHRHPAFYRNEYDQTHMEARERRAEDHKLIKDRKRDGLIWGYGTESREEYSLS